MSSDTQEQIYDDLKLGCHAYHDGFSTSYGYVPSEAAGMVFCALFGLSIVAHVIQFSWKRTWWCSVFAIGCAVEILGWAGRTWSAVCPYNGTAFMIQISTLIIEPPKTAPVFFTAGNYVLLGRFILIFGQETSFLSPKLYLWIFCTCDVISLVIQAAGGGMASSASGGEGDTAPGTNTMVAGIVFQLISTSVFVYCAFDFLRRATRMGLLKMTEMGPITYMIGAMVVSVVVIYIRSIYRVVELAEGWDGYLITHEVYFVVLDGAMMVIAVAVFNFAHPGWLMPSNETFSLPKFQSHEMEAQRLNSSESTEYLGSQGRHHDSCQ
ncbi:RTA1-domain-containing protein [Penicillium argentinense]|uniref:RTA1-domain-containing protein n=1 Tax=Penicillium argentinense TaxID=1131581 RepID=A0A9W9FMR6_9EURO|nr:RTA1-domain-containing protein [Penicillium argentinense]KAJ5103076.1 RTA1-domain-containing protein [Penicillium argentinense]